MSKSNSFRVGKVSCYLRGKVWYLCYFEQGKRLRPRIGADQDAAKQLASQINGRLDTGAPSAMGPVYTLCRLETFQEQLRIALKDRPEVTFAREKCGG